MIDYWIELTCIYACALLRFSNVKFYMHVYYNVNYCKTVRALVQRQRNTPSRCSIIIIAITSTQLVLIFVNNIACMNQIMKTSNVM